MWQQLQFSQPWQALGAGFYSEVAATPLSQPELAIWNAELADSLGLPAELARHPDTALVLGGNLALKTPPSIATVYSGHQFGVWAGQLGDGRALLLGQLQGQEIQLKGAGQTPYSRMGDGRAVLRSSIREYLCSEAMHALGIPTSRALALVHSPEPVWREQAETAAVVTRVAPSFLRFGHFEHFYYRNETEKLQRLVQFAIEQHFPDCLDAANPALAMLEQVVARTAELIAAWQAVGFCHGVMNSDNMSLLGLTLDYGPYGFLDGFDAGHICNHSDHSGRYSYGNQPEIGLFNLQCLAQALLPMIERDQLLSALQSYQGQFEVALEQRFRHKLGLQHSEADDWTLLIRLFDLLQGAHTDWTLFWRTLSHYTLAESASANRLRDLFLDRAGFDAWLGDYRARLVREGSQDVPRQAAMLQANPKYVLRNYLAEQAIRAAQQGEFDELHRLSQVLRQPYTEQPEHEQYAKLPPSWAQELSVSCSS